MRCHILSDESGAVLALAVRATGADNAESRFARRPAQTCHELDLAPEMLGRLKSEGWPLLARLRIIVEDGESRLVA